LATTTDWRDLVGYYSPQNPGFGARLLVELATGAWGVGSRSAYEKGRRQPLALTQGAHRVVYIGLGLWDSFPHFVYGPGYARFMDVDEDGGPHTPEWRARQIEDAVARATSLEDSEDRVSPRHEAPRRSASSLTHRPRLTFSNEMGGYRVK